MADIAKLANVSVSTVSKIVNNKADHIPSSTKNKVLCIIKENNYVPYKKILDKLDRMAIVGLLISDISDIFCAELAKGVEDYFFSKNYSVIIGSTYENSDKELQYVEMLKKRTIQGIIRFPLPNITSETISELEKDEISSVILDNYNQVPNVLKTYFNNREGARIAVEHLVRHGRRRIGYISIKKFVPYLLERYEGYKQALMESDLLPDESLCFISNGQDRRKAGFEGAKYLMSQEVDAIFCSDDYVAAGAYDAIMETDYKIPHDISIVGFDDSMICELLTPNLTSIKQPAYDIGQKSAAMLYNKINGVEPDGKYILLQPQLVARASVARYDGNRKADEKVVVIGELQMNIDFEIVKMHNGVRIVESEQLSPGGWGIERALELVSLGAEVYLIGRVGNDVYGRTLYENLTRSGIRTDGLIFDEVVPTGRMWSALDMAQTKNRGANALISCEQIESLRWIFAKVKFCHIDAQIPAESAARIRQICSENNVKIIEESSLC